MLALGWGANWVQKSPFASEWSRLLTTDAPRSCVRLVGALVRGLRRSSGNTIARRGRWRYGQLSLLRFVGEGGRLAAEGA